MITVIVTGCRTTIYPTNKQTLEETRRIALLATAYGDTRPDVWEIRDEDGHWLDPSLRARDYEGKILSITLRAGVGA